MFFHMMDGEADTVIRIKVWHIISLMIAGIVSLGIYVSGHEARLCVAEKAVETAAKEVIAANGKMGNLELKLDKMSREQDLFFGLREPRWDEWKEWAEKKRAKEEGK